MGMHVVYELARGFLRGLRQNEVRKGCHFLSEIRSVEYLPPVQDVIRAELSEAGLGVPVITVLSPINQSATRLELTRLANGYGDQAATFIGRREASVDTMSPRIAAENQKNLRVLRKLDSDSFRRRVLPSGTRALGELATRFGMKPSPGALSRVLRRPADFPTLTTWLNAQWRMGWTSVRMGVVPGKLDDFRHLVESARCNGFVTNDGNLAKIAPQISPSCRCLSWQELLNMLM